jgi:uncharacterized cupredoxin-like copper-binding protein
LLVALTGCAAAAATALAGMSLAGARSAKHAVTSTKVVVRMTEYAFTLSRTSAPVGTVVFTVINDGEAPHNFAIAGRRTADLAPGAQATLSVSFTSAGAQSYICTLPGHADAGMQGTFTIARSKPTAIVNATEKEWKISLTTSTGAAVSSVKHGLIRFRVRNVGRVRHNFAIARHQTAVLEPGKRATLDVLLTKGRRAYVCSVKGHAALGMKGYLVVR